MKNYIPEWAKPYCNALNNEPHWQRIEMLLYHYIYTDTLNYNEIEHYCNGTMHPSRIEELEKELKDDTTYYPSIKYIKNRDLDGLIQWFFHGINVYGVPTKDIVHFIVNSDTSSDKIKLTHPYTKSFYSEYDFVKFVEKMLEITGISYGLRVKNKINFAPFIIYFKSESATMLLKLVT